MATGYEPAKASTSRGLVLPRRNRRRRFVGQHRDGFARRSRGSHGFCCRRRTCCSKISGRGVVCRTGSVAALVRYGEGRHITALALLPFCAGVFVCALETRQTRALSGVELPGYAQRPANASVCGSDSGAGLWTDSLWQAPSYLQVTARNLQYVAGRGKVGSISLLALVAVAFSIGSWRLARGRPERTWAVFTPRRGRGLVFFKRPGKFVFQLLWRRRTASPGSGTRFGVRSGGYHLLAVVLEPSLAAVLLGSGSHRGGLVCDHYGVPAPCPVPVSRDAGLSEPRRVPDLRLAGEKPAECARDGHWLGGGSGSTPGTTWRNWAAALTRV